MPQRVPSRYAGPPWRRWSTHRCRRASSSTVSSIEATAGRSAVRPGSCTPSRPSCRFQSRVAARVAGWTQPSRSTRSV
ncbi:hypothetical protein ACFQ0B_42455 [Nonomuraea thailandensis]